MKRKGHENDPERRSVEDAEIIRCGNEGPGNGNDGEENDVELLFEKGNHQTGNQEHIVPEWEHDVVLHGQAPIASGSEENPFDVVDVKLESSCRPVLVSLKKGIREPPLVAEVNRLV